MTSEAPEATQPDLGSSVAEAERHFRRVRRGPRIERELCDGSCACCGSNHEPCPCGSGNGAIDCLSSGKHPAFDRG